MSYSSNLPAGAEYDPRAPWNEPMNVPEDEQDYEPKSYIVTFSVSYIIDDPIDMDEDIRLVEEELKHIGLVVDNVEYEEI